MYQQEQQDLHQPSRGHHLTNGLPATILVSISEDKIIQHCLTELTSCMADRSVSTCFPPWIWLPNSMVYFCSSHQAKPLLKRTFSPTLSSTANPRACAGDSLCAWRQWKNGSVWRVRALRLNAEGEVSELRLAADATFPLLPGYDSS